LISRPQARTIVVEVFPMSTPAETLTPQQQARIELGNLYKRISEHERAEYIARIQSVTKP
jgi:hypothetical protein